MKNKKTVFPVVIMMTLMFTACSEEKALNENNSLISTTTITTNATTATTTAQTTTSIRPEIKKKIDNILDKGLYAQEQWQRYQDGLCDTELERNLVIHALNEYKDLLEEFDSEIDNLNYEEHMYLDEALDKLREAEGLN